MDIYAPAEDSFLLEKWVKSLSFGDVLDIGTGSGIQALQAIKNPNVKSVLAIDINKDAIHKLKNNPNLKAKVSNKFDKINQKFDTIVCNPPYLPQDKGIYDPALYGGQKGYEFIQDILESVSNYLKSNGQLLLLFSSFSKKDVIDDLIRQNLLEKKQLDKIHISFEDLYVYKITKQDIRKVLEQTFNNIKPFSKGKRGLILKAKLKNTNVAIKIKNPRSESLGAIRDEILWLEKLNPFGIGPVLLEKGNSFLAYKFVKGDLIFDYFKNSSKQKIKQVFKKLFEQCEILDNLNINKEEMHRPFKHVLIFKDEVTMIDFERCHYSNKPHNITQLCQFLTWGRLNKILEKRNIAVDTQKIRKLAKEYAKTNKSVKSKVLACIN